MPATTNTYLKSLVVFTSSCLKVCLSTMVRHMPGLAPQVVASAPSLLARPRLHVRPQTVEKLIATILVLLSSLPDLCSPAGEEVAPWHQSSNLLFWGRFVWSSNWVQGSFESSPCNAGKRFRFCAFEGWGLFLGAPAFHRGEVIFWWLPHLWSVQSPSPFCKTPSSALHKLLPFPFSIERFGGVHQHHKIKD